MLAARSLKESSIHITQRLGKVYRIRREEGMTLIKRNTTDSYGGYNRKIK